MKPDKLMDAIGHVDDDLIEQAAVGRQPRRDRRLWLRWTAVAACLCVAAGTALLWPWEKPLSDGEDMAVSYTADDLDNVMDQSQHTIVVSEAVSLAKAKHPELAPFVEDYNDPAREAWYADRRAQREQSKDYADGLNEFYQATMEQFLAGKAGENRVYSPLNIYMALSMLAETVDGSSRAQILSLLGRKDIAAVRAAAGGLWNANYQDDGYASSILGNSVWLDKDIGYVQSTLDRLAQTYYASAFAGEMGSPAYNAALQEWLNEQTGGLLKDQVAGMGMTPDTVLALVSSIYFSERWMETFDPAQTRPAVFHATGGDITCDFMNKKDPLCPVYFGNGYKAVRREFRDGRAMWLLLPDEGVSVNTLIEQENIPADLSAWSEADYDFDYYDVSLSMPRFDVTAEADLIDGLKELGVTDIFDSSRADFSPMLTQPEGVCVSKVSHAARVKVDEEGCEAAAYTMMLAGMGAPQVVGHIDFNLNRPFLFFITSTDDVLLFAGAVENP